MDHPHSDTLVITTWIANCKINRMLVGNGSVVEIIYLNMYKRMGLNEGELSLTTSPLYGFIGDYTIPKGTIKLAVTVGEHP